MQPARTRVGVARASATRIVAVARLARVIALTQAHDAAVAQVDGGR